MAGGIDRLGEKVGRGLGVLGFRLEAKARRRMNARVSPFPRSDNGLVAEERGSARGIVITTFEKRQFDRALPLVEAIRASGCDYPILIVLNGNLRGDHDRANRMDFLRAVSDIENVEIVTLRKMCGMSHNWNLGIRLIETDATLVLSDDLMVDSELFLTEIDQAFVVAERDGFCLINGAFAHFVFTDRVRQTVGLFDERFIGFGEEDGDFMWRHIYALGRPVSECRVPAIRHTQDRTRGDDAAGVDKYSLANATYLQEKYRFGEGNILSTFDRPARKVIPEWDPDPLYRVRTEGRSILESSDREVVRSWFRSILVEQASVEPLTQVHRSESVINDPQ